MPSAARVLPVGITLAVLTAVTGCASHAMPHAPASTGTGAAGTITVTSSANACDLSATTVPGGSLTFSVTNTGNDVTEFYLLAADGRRVVGEAENIGPGLSRDLVVQAAPGSYVAACKPGMSGDGIRHDLTVTAPGS